MPGDHLTNAIKVNAQLVSEELKDSKPILQDAVRSSGVKIVSAYYNLGRGEVEFMD